MSVFALPAWLDKHRFKNKEFKGLSDAELLDLKERLARFQHDSPEVSVVIPAWNEENNIYRSLSSLADSNTGLSVEIVVINNNSTDRTQDVLETLGVRTYLQPTQGTPFARQLGLEMARGKYHLCADSDTLYPPDWIDLMVKPMKERKGVVGVYGRYAFVPPANEGRFLYWVYERVAGLIIRFRKAKREHLNVLGFNMGLITEVGRRTGGFKVDQVRKFDNAMGSDYFVDEAEDGKMAINLKKEGTLHLVTNPRAMVYTSSRRLVAEGGLARALKHRVRLHSSRFQEYLTGK